MNLRHLAPPVISASLAVISCVADWHNMGLVVLITGVAAAFAQFPLGRCRCDDSQICTGQRIISPSKKESSEAENAHSGVQH